MTHNQNKELESCVCGTCAYHIRDKESGKFICQAEKSDVYGCETPYTYVCEEYEDRY